MSHHPAKVDCACGGILRSTMSTLDAKRDAVRLHNETEQHRRWVALEMPRIFAPEPHRPLVTVVEPGPDEPYEGRLDG